MTPFPCIFLRMEKDDRYTRITLRIPKELHERLSTCADETSKSMNAEIIGRLEHSFEYERRAIEKLDEVRSFVESLKAEIAQKVEYLAILRDEYAAGEIDNQTLHILEHGVRVEIKQLEASITSLEPGLERFGK